jgi:nucleoside-diphosphate-sugar epimerase
MLDGMHTDSHDTKLTLVLGGTGRTGRRVVQRLHRRARDHGVPPEVVERLTYLFREVVDGRNADTTDGVRRALEREPRDFAQYAGDAAASGAWTAPRDVAA